MAKRIDADLPSSFSDGISSKWPKGDYVWAPDDKLYQEKLADLGKDLIEGSRAGQKYIFNELPSGYRTYTKERKDGRIKDRYIFGHPNGRFDSPIKFFVHFRWMMQNGEGDCDCVNCKNHGVRNASIPSTAAAASRTGVATHEEPNPYSLTVQLERFIKILDNNPESLTGLTVSWEESPSQGPHKPLDGQNFVDMVSKYQTVPSFLPRKGELVLFYTEEEFHCSFEETTQQFRAVDKYSGEFSRFPEWKAGVIAAEPKERIGHEDLSPTSQEHLNVINNSYRIELYPDPSGKDKNLSSEVHLIPLYRIRPLSTYHEFLSGFPQDQWHETIRNALRISNTVALVDPIEFVGTQLSYSIKYRGLWMGPELFVVGDAVRLLPSQPNESQVDQVVIIRHINQQFKKNNQSSVTVAGPVFTTNKRRSFPKSPSIVTSEQQEQLLPASTTGYSWYSLDISTNVSSGEASSRESFSAWQEIPASYIMGRLYDAEAMKILFDIYSFDVGALGVQRARRWARQHGSTSKVNNDQLWILKTDRMEALDLDSLNGKAVGRGSVQKQGRRGYRNRSGTGHKASFSAWKQTREEILNTKSFAQSSTFNNYFVGSEDEDEEGPGQEAIESGGTSDMDGNNYSDHDCEPPGSVKSIVTDRTVSWSKTENENAQNFISEVIAGAVLPQAVNDEDEDLAGREQERDMNEDGPGRNRPAKRPRL